MKKFVIYTPVYRENSGGIIVLHKLASILNSIGCDAKIWPLPKPSLKELCKIQGWLKLINWFKLVLILYIKRKDVRSPYDLNVAKQRDVADSVVVYPEIVLGNPLNAKYVVRWLLNKPGAIYGNVEFGRGDLFFFYNHHFNDWRLNPNKENHLNVSEIMGDVYVKKNNGKRTGQCYMVRKGRGRSLTYHDDSALNVDGLSHRELADIFNECEYFISYDIYTMYCRYAAMCGCIPVVVPQEGLLKEEWRPEIFNRYGIAYGWDDIPWALESRDKLMEFLADSENRGYESVKNFVALVEKQFGNQPWG